MKNRPALKVFLFFALGLTFARYFVSDLTFLFFSSGVLFITAFFLWTFHVERFRLTDIILVLSLIAVGCIRYDLATGYFPSNHISHFTEFTKPVEIVGTVVNYPNYRPDKTTVVVEATGLFHERQVRAVKGRLLMNIRFPNSHLSYGDEIKVKGKLRRPRDRRNPGEFDYRDYLMAQDIFATLSVYRRKDLIVLSSGHGKVLFREFIVPVKSYLDRFISSSLPEKESALLHGLLIGERGGISPELKNQFSNAGVIHLLAVSGLHVGFVLLIFLGVFGIFRIPYETRVLLAIAGLIFYASLTNLKPPVVRASIMGGILLLGTLLERKSDVYNTLSIAALCILTANPLELFQPGFQLSFAAVLSIIYIYPKIKEQIQKISTVKRWFKFAIVRYVFDLFLISAAAMLGTLPFTVLYFNRLPMYTLFTNLAVIPLAFCGIASGLVGSLANLFSNFTATIYMHAAWFFLHGLIKTVEFAATLPWSHIEIYRFPLSCFIIYLTLLFFLLNFGDPRVRRWLVILLLVLSNFFIWQKALAGSANLQVTYLDVGQGDAALITLPDGRNLMVDCGPKSMHFDAGERIVVPFLKRQGIKEIQTIILSHADADHLGGFPYLLRHLKVHEVWDNGQGKETLLYKDYAHLIDSLKITHRIFNDYAEVKDFSPVHVYVLHPTDKFLRVNKSDLNDRSLSFKLSYGDIDFLFIGDVERTGESAMERFGSFLQSEVLKVAHHGSNTSSTLDFLKDVKPQIAVISVGKFNKFKHPSDEVLHRLHDLHAKILRTDREAAIILRSRGNKVERVFWK